VSSPRVSLCCPALTTPAVSWQFLVNNQLGGTLDTTNFGKYDQLMQACLSTGAYCAIDIHNFARFNGQIIGQSSGGPTDAQFADLWSQLATKYKSNGKVVFGLMNEPHDVDITAWANSVQAAVTAIRNAGATTQMILLPGNNFTSAATFVSNGSAAALSNVTNPDGSITGLLLDVHKYLDVDNSGEHAECTTDNIASAFQLVADFLRQNNRQAIVSETGAGSTSSCFTDFCAQNTFLNQNSDVFLGYIAWAAGSFSTSYVLSLTPSKQNGKFVDNQLASQCVVAPWLNASNTATFISSAVMTSTVVGSSAAATSETGTVATTGSGEALSTLSGQSTAATMTTTANGGTTIQTSASATQKSTKSSGLRNGTAIASATPLGSAGSQTSSAATQSTGRAYAQQVGKRLLVGSLLVAAFI
jgi:endoglucanase